MYKKGDFHMHSTESDGDLKPGELVILAKERNIDIISLTDHNTTRGIEEAVKVGEIYGVKVIPGIELSARYKGNRVHILGYFKGNSYDDYKFKESLVAFTSGNSKKAMSILNHDISLSTDGRKPTVQSAIKYLKYFNCIVILAHPVLLKREIFFKLIECDFDGIEAKYYRNKEEDTNFFIQIAKKNGMIYTAGSDFHSNKKVNLNHGTLGQIYLEEFEIKKLLDKL